jgi:hypothetical protein
MGGDCAAGRPSYDKWLAADSYMNGARALLSQDITQALRQ